MASKQAGRKGEKTMTSYSIDDGDGTNNASGIQSFDRAIAIAQRVANDTGMVAFVYSDDGDEWVVDPD